MSWTQIFNDTFSRSDGPVGNGWLDPNSAWSIASGVAGSVSASFAADFLTRPALEYSSANDQRAVAKLTTAGDGTFNTPLVWLRKQSGSASGYVCWCGKNGSTPILAYGRMDAGTLTIDNSHAATGLADSTDVIITFDVIGSTINCSVALASAPSTPLVSFTKTDSTYAAGTVGLTPLASPNKAKQFTSFGTTPPDTSTTRVVCSGNSLTAGSSLDGSAVPYPTSLATLLGPTYSVVNSGIGGQTGAQILAGFTAQIGSHLDPSKSNKVVVWEGTNSLYFNATPAQAYADLVAISQAVKAVDPTYQTLNLTVLPRGDFPGTSTIPGNSAAQNATFESNRQALNTLIRANSGGFNRVVDVASDARIGVPGANLDTAYYDASTVHLNAAGYFLIAQKVAGVIAPSPNPGAITPRAIAMPSGGSVAVLPYDASGNRVQVLSIQSGNDEQSFVPSKATAAGTFTLSFLGQTTAPINYTAADPSLVATFHGIPATPGVAVNLSLTVAQSVGFTARVVLCEVIEGGFVRASANFDQDDIGVGDFQTVNDQNGGAGLSSWLTLFPGYVPTTSSLSIRMTAPITASPTWQSIWVADGLHVREVVSGIVTIYDDSDAVRFSATGFTGSSVCCYGQYYNGTFHAFPYGGGTGSVCSIDPLEAKAKLEALSTIGAGNVQVIAAGGGIKVQFVGAMGATAQPDITTTSPAIVSNHTVGGFVPTLHVTHQGGATEDVVLRQLWIPFLPGLMWAIYVFDAAQLGFTLAATDSMTLTVPPGGWMTTAGGTLAAGTYPVENRVGGTMLPEFAAVPKTMPSGQNVQPDTYYSECPTFANFADRSGLEHVAPVGNKVVLQWDANGDPTLMSTDAALAIVTQAPQGSNDGVGGILPLNAPNGLWTFLWDGPFTGGGVSGQHSIFTERMDLQVPTNTTNNRRVYDVQAVQSQQAAPWINWTYLASGPADGSGNSPCATKNLRIYPPDPSDPTGQTPWLAPTGRFHPSYLAKLATCRVIRPMQAYDTFFNPIADFDQYKPANWLDRSGPQITQRVAVSRVEQYTGAAKDNTHTLVLKFTTVQPHGFFTGQSVSLEHCGTATLSQSLTINGTLKNTLVLAETNDGDIGSGSVDVIDDHTFAFHSIKTVLNSGGIETNVNGVTMTNILTGGGAARGTIGTSWALDDSAILMDDLKAAYPAVARRRMWFCVPVSATDACIDALGAYWAANLTTGFELCAEWGNECWNFRYATYGWMRIRNFQVNGATDDTYAKAYAQAQINVNTRFQAAFTAASRAGDFVHVFATQSSDTANTTIMLGHAHSVSARVDVVAIAPYIGSYNPGAVPLDPARTNLFTAGQCLDVLELNTDDPGINYTAANRAAIDVYYPSARIETYEGGPESLVPGFSGNAYAFSNIWDLQHAVHRHPRFFRIYLRMLQSFQDEGISLYTNFYAFGGSSVEAWSTDEWYNEQPGTGDASENPDFRNTSALTSGGQVPVVSQTRGAMNLWNSLVGASPSTLAPGTATAGSTTNTTASATATEATGNTGTIAHQWYRSTIIGQTGSLVPTQTTLTLADTGLTPGVTYYYKLKYTDDTGSVYSNQVTLTTTGGGPAPSLSQSTATISVGQSITLTASNFTGGSVTWASTDTSKATVASGLVTAILAGSATITATGVTDNTQTATCVVTVNPAFVNFVLTSDILPLTE